LNTGPGLKCYRVLADNWLQSGPRR